MRNTGKKDLTKPDGINRLRETDIHHVSTARDGMIHLMGIKDCFSKRWISYEISRFCTAKDCASAVEKAYMERFPGGMPLSLILRTDNGPQYTAGEFGESMKILGIRQEYIQKHTPEDNGDIESFHNSLKTDYIWTGDIETFGDAWKLIEYAFNDYNTMRPHSSISFLPPVEFERRWNEDEDFRKTFMEERKRRLKNRMEKKKEVERKCLIGRWNFCPKLRGSDHRGQPPGAWHVWGSVHAFPTITPESVPSAFLQLRVGLKFP